MKYLKKEDLEKLPKEMVERIKETLKAYPEITVTYENGEYQALVGCGLKASYSPDYKFIGTFRDKDIYSYEERIQNYMQVFNESERSARNHIQK